LNIDPQLVLDLPESSDPLSGFDAGISLTEELLRRNRNFTAIMAFDDLTAFGAIRALSRNGIAVPQQCSVIGFDGIAQSSLLTPSLTTMRQPMEEMGRMAVTIVADGINASHDKRRIAAAHRKLVPELVVRDSTTQATLSQ
jgi:LacI family transcriptional regulator